MPSWRSTGTPAPCLSNEVCQDGAVPFEGKHGGMISVQKLSKRFGAQTAVNELSFEVPAGQIVGFLGPNGAGKSTTLKMLTGMLEPSEGTANICGFDLRRQPIEVKRHVGFVPESGAVFE